MTAATKETTSSGDTAADSRSVPPLAPSLDLLRGSLVLLSILSITLLVQLLLISGIQQRSAQHKHFAAFRGELSLGTASTGAVDGTGRQLRPGTPVAYIEIPSIGVKQVVAEGTSANVLLAGPGHRRDTPLPGQIGTSIVFGRRTTYGGPFRRLGSIKAGDPIRVTTSQGVFDFVAIGPRKDGALPKAPKAGTSRLTLVTSSGSVLVPSGLTTVDADLKGTAVVGPRPVISASALPAEERALHIDTRTLGVLALWLQALILLSIAAVWAWHRWGRVQAWVVFLPALLLVGLAVAGEITRLLPNLL